MNSGGREGKKEIHRKCRRDHGTNDSRVKGALLSEFTIRRQGEGKGGNRSTSVGRKGEACKLLGGQLTVMPGGTKKVPWPFQILEKKRTKEEEGEDRYI